MANSDVVPVCRILTDAPQFERFTSLRKLFTTRFGEKPSVLIQVPGRVNLIGEHIDYCGYAVFPMAIQQDILIAAHSNGSQELRLTNTDSVFKDYVCPDMGKISIEKGNPEWYKYFLCGVKGVLDERELCNPVGMNVALDGTIPPSAGLSSSSALVCAAALTTTTMNKVEMTKKDLASLCARSEKHIGTEGGGMDQAIAFLANAGSAKLIEFSPLRATNVKLPDGAVFVIANSLAEANKAATSHYNCRVVECRLATQLIAKRKNLDWEKLRRLGDMQQALSCSLDDMIEIVQDVLHQEPYTKQEICQDLGVTEQQLNEMTLSENTHHIQSFKLYQRALHVFSEANRVWLFKKICEEGSSEALEKLGGLMFESHASCRDLYECSHPLLDKLVQLSHGIAYGARLTGAGWGGCLVALVPKDKLDTYLTKLKTEFYDSLPAAQGRDMGMVLFLTEPGVGALIYRD